MQVKFTSDLHFDHTNLLLPTYTRRGQYWSNVDQMNEGIIAKYNEVVEPEDTVYILGDFAMGRKDMIPNWFRRLNGKKHLILGNHDYVKPGKVRPQIIQAAKDGLLEDYCEHLSLTVNGKKLLLNHEPVRNVCGGDYVLCGHVHDSFSRAKYVDGDGVRYEPNPRFEPDPDGEVINVGVDVSEFRPMTLEQLLARPFYEGKRHRI